MGPAPASNTTWQQKVLRVLRGDAPEVPFGALSRLARRLGRPQRTVYNWLEVGRSPRNEAALIKQVAAALGVDPDWLTDGRDTPPVQASDPVPDETLRRVPTKYRRLLFALADGDTADWLLAQLDLYERARLLGRRLPR